MGLVQELSVGHKHYGNGSGEWHACALLAWPCVYNKGGRGRCQYNPLGDKAHSILNDNRNGKAYFRIPHGRDHARRRVYRGQC
jgi:hypothetical protein